VIDLDRLVVFYFVCTLVFFLVFSLNSLCLSLSLSLSLSPN
jgi:hypothetical protein